MMTAFLPALARLTLVAGVFVTALPAAPAPLEWTAAPAVFTADHLQAEIGFSLVNASDAPLTITAVEASCGCTVVETPAQPWVLPPQAQGNFVARIDLRGKRGELHKTIRLITSGGDALLPVRIRIPESPVSSSRLENQLVALNDARAIFRDDCARCHATPAAGKTGRELYVAACAICHDAHFRAEAVPDLAVATKDKPADYLRGWITEGKTGTLMPPFAREKGGILDAAQIESLVEFLRNRDQSPKAP
jgi:hypothetical protein